MIVMIICQLSNFSLYINHSCNCMIAVRTSSEVVGAEYVACHALLRIVQLFNFAVFTTL